MNSPATPFYTDIVDNPFEAGLGFGFGRLDQHRAVDDQREIHGHRVEALVDQRLGEIDGAQASREAFVREDRLVHARARARERRVEHVLEAP